jgi:hypothetical protein
MMMDIGRLSLDYLNFQHKMAMNESFADIGGDTVSQ